MGDHPVVGKLAACLYLAVGLVRFHGTKKDDQLGARSFLFLVAVIALLSLLALYAPVPGAIPSMLFLVMQIVNILKSYHDKGKTARDGLLWIACAVAAGTVAFFGALRYQNKYHGNDASGDDMQTALVSQEGGAAPGDGGE